MTTHTRHDSGHQARRSGEPRRPALPREVAMRLAATEYQRFADLLGTLGPGDWTAPTECPGWDVRAMAAHALGMVEMAASVRESMRQQRLAGQRQHGGLFIDALTALQVEERQQMTGGQIASEYRARGPKAGRARRRTPGLLLRHPLPPRKTDGTEAWTLGYLIDIILTRDPWMHRADIARATGADLVLTADHDGVLVADVVTEWAARHGQPYTLRLTGPAGGTWSRGAGGPDIETDAVEFCRLLSGRGHADGLLATQVPF